MNDDLDALLRDHYSAAADGIHADPGTVRRFQDAGRAAAPARFIALRRWTFPALAAAVTAAVLVAVAVLFWPGARHPAPPRPLAPPASPASSPSPTPSARPGTVRPSPSTTPEAATPTPTGTSSVVPPAASPTANPEGRPSGPGAPPATPAG
ncbi:hypothetical protein ACQPZP_35705 [Spirillospora sp. CA-142024]|uniref:hypothetical protein n=1 Tax=Spirillospora sp. CA-142024 TaxID=3240036 RepID=UPI003D8AB2CA